jgi:hypothetical protein
MRLSQRFLKLLLIGNFLKVLMDAYYPKHLIPKLFATAYGISY